MAFSPFLPPRTPASDRSGWCIERRVLGLAPSNWRSAVPEGRLSQLRLPPSPKNLLFARIKSERDCKKKRHKYTFAFGIHLLTLKDLNMFFWCRYKTRVQFVKAASRPPAVRNWLATRFYGCLCSTVLPHAPPSPAFLPGEIRRRRHVYPIDCLWRCLTPIRWPHDDQSHARWAAGRLPLAGSIRHDDLADQ